MSGPIGYDSDQVQHNVVLLTEVPEEIPPSAIISEVEGNRAEDTSAEFTRHLEQRADQLASEVEKVRAWVADHARALSDAVAALRERDAMGAEEAQQALSMIDSATDSTPTGAGGESTSSTQSFISGLPR
ncbi:hypothetical protein ACIPVB_03895 [Microbacterium sp. NPDC090007]|uniref:hypothetical protein n=1 Tax=Microbacterium sp. NPDC090007 TaxID=3364204 RepID=UPI00380EB022